MQYVAYQCPVFPLISAPSLLQNPLFFASNRILHHIKIIILHSDKSIRKA